MDVTLTRPAPHAALHLGLSGQRKDPRTTPAGTPTKLVPVKCSQVAQLCAHLRGAAARQLAAHNGLSEPAPVYAVPDRDVCGVDM
jgi:hypothetical protein